MPTHSVTSEDLQTYWPQVLQWFDRNWRCSAAGAELPQLDWLVQVLEQGTYEIAVNRQGANARGATVYRPSDGRIIWLIALPNSFTLVAEELCSHVANVTGLVPWGVVERDTPMQAFLAGAFELTYEHPQYPEGQVIKYVGA